LILIDRICPIKPSLLRPENSLTAPDEIAVAWRGGRILTRGSWHPWLRINRVLRGRSLSAF